ncbi:MAG: FHA domain-containing protein [Agarilytica sp.]
MADQEQTVAAQFNTEVLKKVNSPATHIELFYQGKELSYSKDDLPKKIGRDEQECDLAVNSSVASRVHCYLEVQDNQIGIKDVSTNGTFLKIGRAESFVVKKNFYPLIGQGNIHLGAEFETDDKDIIFYRMQTK